MKNSPPLSNLGLIDKHMTPKYNKVLNINFKNNSNGIFEHFQYPAGEIQTRLTPEGLVSITNTEQIVLYVDSGLTPKDEIVFFQLLDILTEYQIPIKTIFTYFPYSRADRSFQAGDVFGLKYFIERIGWCTNVTEIETWDVHNPIVTQQLVSSSTSATFTNFTAENTINYVIKNEIMDKYDNQRVINILFPDKGAADRYKLPNELVCWGKTIEYNKLFCTKRRNPTTGKFEGFYVPNTSEFSYGSPILIPDDICDGGGTFNGIVEALEKEGVTTGFACIPEISLYVTHGIFSKGFSNGLKDNFDYIYTTKSFKTSCGAELPKSLKYVNYVI